MPLLRPLTRGVAALAHGDVARAFAHNSVAVGALLALLALAALRLVAGRALRVRVGRTWLIPALLLLAANWAYVIHADGAAAEVGGLGGRAGMPPKPPPMKTRGGVRSSG